MIIFVDGIQNVGKTTLVSNCKYRHNRFPFNEYLDFFKLNKDDLKGFQLGKDLGMLFGLQYSKEDIIFDRGPLSTIFYSLKEERYGENTLSVVLNFFKTLSRYKKCRFVWIDKSNDKQKNKRNHNDGFDYLNDEEDPKKGEIINTMFSLAKTAGVRIYKFVNDYSIKLKQNYHNFNDFLEGLINEHY